MAMARRGSPMKLLLLAAVAAVAQGKKVVSGAVVVKKTDEWKKQMLFSERLIAGAAARGLAQTTLHPIDVLRTRLQAKGVEMVLSPETFVKGIAPQFILAFPAGGIQFAAYEWSKAKCAALNFTGGVAEVLCGAAGALAASIVRVPQEVIKQRVQARTTPKEGLADIYPNALIGFQRLVKEEGLRGFYKADVGQRILCPALLAGYTATVSRDVPWNALSFLFFAQSKALYVRITGEDPSVNANLVLGALSGMLAAVIMTPVDVVKTRLMTGGASGGIVGTATAIIRDEGVATLMKGVVPRAAYLAPLASLTLAFYEAFAKALVAKRLKAEAAAKTARAK